MSENKFDFLSWLSKLPMWHRVAVLLLLAGLAFLLSMSVSSCGQTVRVTVRDTPNGVSISTTQNKSDSSSTSIKINPTINLHGSQTK